MTNVELQLEQRLTEGYATHQHEQDRDVFSLPPFQRRSLRPLSVLGAMLLAVLLLDAILPLRGLWFSDVLLTRLGSWPLLPTQALFPTWSIIPQQTPAQSGNTSGVVTGWFEVGLLLIAFSLIFLVYLYALRRLPEHISRRYIVWSTLALGLLYILIPVVTSPDLFSYLIYARMGIVYHLNPLTTLPTDIHYDPVYPYLYWVDQPSAYGPTWAAITGTLEACSIPFFGVNNVVGPLVLLRLLGLLTHLGSTLLVWSIGGHLQRARGYISPRQRLLATLAFAWNPLLLFEACVNAHNDSTLLLFVLLALWLLIRGQPVTLLYALVTVLLALAACLKINTVVLFPGLLLFLWTRPQPLRKIALCLALYVGLIIGLYAPFWGGGAVLNVLRVNPSASRNINTLAEFAGQVYNALITARFSGVVPIIGSPGERLTHTLSMGLFGVIYLWLCWKTFWNARRISTPAGLIRWMALAWLLYCLIGTPWFWPWYLVTFFGLYALVEAAGDGSRWACSFLRWRAMGILRLPLTFRLLSFSMLAVYCSYAWVLHGTFIPTLPGFELAYLRGLCIWLLPPLAALLLNRKASSERPIRLRFSEVLQRAYGHYRALLQPEAPQTERTPS